MTFLFLNNIILQKLLIFKTKWIILKINNIKHNDFLYTILTENYWKIICQKKKSSKEKTLDLWYIINFEIITKEERKIHKIRNIKILSEFITEWKWFNIINSYLELLSLVLNHTPYWTPILWIIGIFENINKIKDLNEIKIILSKLKVLNILWILNIENENPLIKRILKFIDKNKIDNILKLSWIDEEIKEKLKKIF